MLAMVLSGARALLLAAALFLVGGAAAAGPLDDAATKFVRDLAAKADGVAKRVKDDPTTRDSAFRSLLKEGFDVEGIGQFVLGRHWKSATEDERKRFMALFEKMIVDSYASRLTDYASEQVEIKGTRPEADGTTAVLTEIKRDGQPPVRLDWKVKAPDKDARIIDVNVEGVSLAVTQRSDFASVIRSAGSVSGLNDALEKKLAAPTKKQ